MSNKFRSCQYLEGALQINHNHALYPCCVNNLTEGDWWEIAKIADFNGGDFPLEQLIEYRENARKMNQNGGFPICKGCVHLEEKVWEDTGYVFNELIINHFVKCNVHCIYCTCPELETPPEMDLLPTIQNMIDEKWLSPSANIFWGGGEPTISRGFEPILNLLTEYGCQSTIATNAARYSKAVEHALKSGKANICCSLDAGTRESFKDVKRFDYFDRTIENLRKYSETGGPILLKKIILPENCSEESINSFVQIAKEINATAIIYDVNHKTKEQPDEVVHAMSLMIREAILNDVEFREGGAVKLGGKSLQLRLQTALFDGGIMDVVLDRIRAKRQLNTLLEINN